MIAWSIRVIISFLGLGLELLARVADVIAAIGEAQFLVILVVTLSLVWGIKFLRLVRDVFQAGARAIFFFRDS